MFPNHASSKEWVCQKPRDRWGEGSMNHVDEALEIAGGLKLLSIGLRKDLETTELGHKVADM